MKIITSNPTIVNGEKVSSSDKYISATGDVLPYRAVGSVSPVADYLDRDDFYPAEGPADEFSYAIGDKKGRKEKRKARIERIRSKNKARETRAQSKIEQAKSQQMMADSLSKTGAGDAELAKALASPSSSKKTKGLSTGAKIGIAVGILAVLGIGTYMILKSKKVKTA